MFEVMHTRLKTERVRALLFYRLDDNGRIYIYTYVYSLIEKKMQDLTFTFYLPEILQDIFLLGI